MNYYKKVIPMINEKSMDEKVNILWKIIANDPKLVYDAMNGFIDIDDDVREMHRNGVEKIPAIKKIREKYKISLKDAADFVNNVYNQ